MFIVDGDIILGFCVLASFLIVSNSATDWKDSCPKSPVVCLLLFLLLYRGCHCSLELSSIRNHDVW